MHPNNQTKRDDCVTHRCDTTWFEEEVYTSDNNEGPPPLMDNDGDSSSDESVDSVMMDESSTTSNKELVDWEWEEEDNVPLQWLKNKKN